MKGFYYSTFLLVTIFITNCLSKSNPCRHVQDKAYINDPSSCDAYFKCENGKEISGKCPKDLWFDKISGICNYKSDVECKEVEIKDPCKNQCNNIEKECFVDNPINCAAYYYCKDDKAIAGECENGQHFDPATSRCIHKSDSKCKDDDEVTPSNVCEDIPNLTFVRSSKDCHKYYRCIANKPYELSCTEKAYFNLKTATCDKKEEVECDVKDDEDKPSCKGKPDGEFIKDPNSCAGWYRCENNEAGDLGKCDKYQWFDVDKQSCDWSNQMPESKCANRCEDKQNGFVVAPGTNCEDYYNCQNGKINGDKQKCGPGLVFEIDTEHCIKKSSDFKCPSV